MNSLASSTSTSTRRHSLLEGALPLARCSSWPRTITSPPSASPIPTICSVPWSFRRRRRGRASSRCSACELAVRVRDRRPTAPSSAVIERDRFGKGGVVLIAATETGFTQSPGLVSAARISKVRTAAPPQLDWLTASNSRRHHLPFGWPRRRRSIRSSPPASTGEAERRLEALRAPVRRPALCRAAAPRPAQRAGERSQAHRPRLSPRRAAGRHQRALLRPRARTTRRMTR